MSSSSASYGTSGPDPVTVVSSVRPVDESLLPTSPSLEPRLIPTFNVPCDEELDGQLNLLLVDADGVIDGEERTGVLDPDPGRKSDLASFGSSIPLPDGDDCPGSLDTELFLDTFGVDTRGLLVLGELVLGELVLVRGLALVLGLIVVLGLLFVVLGLDVEALGLTVPLLGPLEVISESSTDDS